MKIIMDNGNEYQVAAENLGTTLAQVKGVPEQDWLRPEMRYVETAYVKGPTGTYEPVFIVVVEQEPTVRTISYQNNFAGPGGGGYHNAAYKTAQLSFPYIVNVFVVRVNGDQMNLDKSWPLSFYRTQPLVDFTDDLRVNNLPNVRIDPWNDAANNAAIGWTCYHNAPTSVTNVKIKKGESEKSALSRLVGQVLGYYWDASFTGSAGAVTAWKETAAKVPEVKSVAEWEKQTKADPSFVLRTKWLPHPKKANLGAVIKSVREAIQAVPVSNPRTTEQAPLVCPDSKLTEKRFEAVLKVATGVVAIGKHLKLY